MIKATHETQLKLHTAFGDYIEPLLRWQLHRKHKQFTILLTSGLSES